MESWSYVSGEREFASNETISSSDSFARKKNLPWWVENLKDPCGFNDTTMLVTGHQSIGNRGLLGLGDQECMPKQSTTDERILNPFVINPTSLSDNSTARFSSTMLESNSRDTSFIDLKLGRFGDTHNCRGATSVVSSSESSAPAKRQRSGGNPPVAYCQVYSCHKDLSSSKDYHRRHKVCEVHSKTAKVIVNGIEQRFCQQCSRFHLLPEFDDGKRSCRKRLAGHNKRRRKPQVGILGARNSSLFQPYNGFTSVGLHGTNSFTASTFICQDILPSSLLQNPDKYSTYGTDFSSLSAIPITRHLNSKTTFAVNNNFNKVLLNHNGNGSNSDNNPIGSTLFCDISTANSYESFAAFDAASTTIQGGISTITDSGCALSLLSFQSQNSSAHSLGPGCNSGNAHYSVSQVSEKLIGVIPQGSSRVMNNGHFSHVLLPNVNNDAINFNIVDGVYQDRRFVNDNDQNGTTIDLLRLSSQLQRVENEKQKMLLKEENDAFCCPPIT